MQSRKLSYASVLTSFVALSAMLFVLQASPAAAQAQDNRSVTDINDANNPQRNNNRALEAQNGDLAVSAVTVVNGAYGAAEIATLPRNGGPYHFLTTAGEIPNGALDPTFTPDGRTIFFWTLGAPDQTYSVPVTGGPLTLIHTDCLTNPICFGDDVSSISPDGQEFLATRGLGPLDQGGCPSFIGIYRFHIDGSHAVQLSPSRTTPACVGDDEGRWSPDGNSIVFQHGDMATGLTIWIMQRDGSHRRQLSPAGMNTVGDPNWSPDGQLITFQSPEEPDNDQHPQQIYTIHPDGTHLRQITHYAVIRGVTIATYGARWSPDGTRIVFAHRDPYTTIGPDGLPHADVFEMNPDGSDVVQITFSPEKDNGPAWGPAPR